MQYSLIFYNVYWNDACWFEGKKIVRVGCDSVTMTNWIHNNVLLIILVLLDLNYDYFWNIRYASYFLCSKLNLKELPARERIIVGELVMMKRWSEIVRSQLLYYNRGKLKVVYLYSTIYEKSIRGSKRRVHVKFTSWWLMKSYEMCARCAQNNNDAKC